MTAKALTVALPPQAWRIITWRDGTNSELGGRFIALRVRAVHRDCLGTDMRPEEWLLIERPDSDDEPARYGCLMAWQVKTDGSDTAAKKLRPMPSPCRSQK